MRQHINKYKERKSNRDVNQNESEDWRKKKLLYPSGKALVEANRGSIFEYFDPYGRKEEQRLAMVIGAQDRYKDKLVSILLLTPQSCDGRDTVPVEFDGQTWYAHGGLVTYCYRGQLGNYLGTCPDDALWNIGSKIITELGL